MPLADIAASICRWRATERSSASRAYAFAPDDGSSVRDLGKAHAGPAINTNAPFHRSSERRFISIFCGK